MSGGKRRETGSRKDVPEEVKLAKRRSLLDHTKDDIQRLRGEVQRHGEDAPPNIVIRLNEAQDKVDSADEFFTEYHVDAAVSAVSTLMLDPSLTGIRIISGSRKGARISGFDEEIRQARLEEMRRWLRDNPERRRGWKARFGRDMAEKWDIKFDAARKFIDRHLKEIGI